MTPTFCSWQAITFKNMQKAFFFLFCLCFLVLQATAQDKSDLQDWKLQSKGLITETYTAPAPDTVFGLFCSAEKCVFYLHNALTCQPNAHYSVLLNSEAISTAVTMKCTPIGANLFWILSPFDVVLRATQLGDQIGFAVAIQSGAFAVSRFSLIGANRSITDGLLLAAKKKIPPPVISPPVTPKKIEPRGPTKKDIEI